MSGVHQYIIYLSFSIKIVPHDLTKLAAHIVIDDHISTTVDTVDQLRQHACHIVHIPIAPIDSEPRYKEMYT